jgi:hypothetical protein
MRKGEKNFLTGAIWLFVEQGNNNFNFIGPNVAIKILVSFGQSHGIVFLEIDGTNPVHPVTTQLLSDLRSTPLGSGICPSVAWVGWSPP